MFRCEGWSLLTIMMMWMMMYNVHIRCEGWSLMMMIMMWMMMNMSGARDGLGAAAENLPQGEE